MVGSSGHYHSPYKILIASSDHLQTHESAIGEYLLHINAYRFNYPEDLSVLYRVRTKYQLNILETVVVMFWPGQKCHSRWCTGRKWHILMAVMRGNRVGGNWLMKWNVVKKIPWYSHRLTHRKRVTSELHDSYFRLMTIKHSISKIKWALNYYIAQSRQKSSQLSCSQLERRCGRESHIRPGGGLWALMSWGPEKMLIRCRKESHRPAEWPLDLRLIIWERERHNVDGHKFGVKIFVMFDLQLPLTRKPWVTLFEPLQ